MSRREQALRDYGLFAAGVLTGLGAFLGVGFAIGAAAIVCGLIAWGFVKQLREFFYVA